MLLVRNIDNILGDDGWLFGFLNEEVRANR